LYFSGSSRAGGPPGGSSSGVPGLGEERLEARPGEEEQHARRPLADNGVLVRAIFISIAAAASGGILVGPAAAAGIAHAFLTAAHVALGASAAALIALPAAKTFLPKLRLNPSANADALLDRPVHRPRAEAPPGGASGVH
jgi:hypothetical protein